MRKIIGCFIGLIFILLGCLSMYEYDLRKERELLNALQNTFRYEFYIPDYQINGPERLELLKDVADKTQVNLIRRVEQYQKDTQTSEYRDYIYLTNDTSFFNRISVKEGQILTVNDMEEGNKFLSTVFDGDKNRLGRILDFGEVTAYSIFPINSLVKEVEYPGRYFVECETDDQFQFFIQEYVREFQQHISQEVEVEDLIMVPDALAIKQVDDSTFEIAIACLFIILFLIGIVYLIYQSKAIAIMKLNGYSIPSIQWRLFYWPFFKIIIVVHLFLIIVSFTIHDISLNFFAHWGTLNSWFIGLFIMGMTILSRFYIQRIKEVETLKGKKPIQFLLIGNIGITTVLSLGGLVLLAVIFNQVKEMKLQQNTLANWEDVASYGVFTPVKAGEDSGSSVTLDVAANDFYPFLNREFGTIYINAYEYTEDMLEANPNPDQLRLIKVNPNYLKKFPIYDEYHQQIMIDEETDYYIYLVPEKYKKHEKKLKEFLQDFRDSYHEIHEEFYGQDSHSDSQDIAFIYTANNQQIFSMNEQVYKNQGNVIEDPIIGVMTEGNRLVPDCFYATSLIQNLFVPLIQNSTELTYEKMLPVLKSYQLDDNFQYFVKKNDVILSQINEIQEGMEVYLTMGMTIFLVLGLLMIQYIYLMFQVHRYDFFLKKINGFSRHQIYSKIYVTLGILVLVEGVVGYLVSGGYLGLFLMKGFIEILLVTLIVLYFEKSNVMVILKERS